MDKFKESLSNILKSMVPSKESRKETVERFKSQFKSDPNTAILKDISLSVSRSNEILESINETLDKQKEEKEKSFGGKLFDVLKSLGKALLVVGGLGVAIAKLTGIPDLIGKAIKSAFAAAGLGKLFTALRPTPTPNMTKPTATAGAVRIVGPLPLPVKGLGMGGGGVDVDGERKGGRKGRGVSRVGATEKLDKVLERNKTNKALDKVSSKGPGSYDTKRLDASKIAKDQAKKKLLATAAAKSAAKKIPGGGAVAGTAFAAGRAKKGDYAGAAMEFGSGLLGAIPLLGIPASLAIDAALLNRDMEQMSELEKAEMIQHEKDPSKMTQEEIDALPVEEKRKMFPGLVFDDDGNLDSAESSYQRELKLMKEGKGGYFAGTHDADPASMANKRQHSQNLKQAQMRSEAPNRSQNNPINVVNNNTNNVSNNNTTVANKTKPRNNESALERELSRHTSFGF